MEDNNKLIYKNTLYLYLRQLVVMVLAFFTTRIVLEKLGVDDYGLYNVVGGFVALFSILNGVLASATRRFISLSIGFGDKQKIKKTFSTSLVMHIVIGMVIVVLLETIGLYLLNTTLNIAPDRMYAANWVFHLSVIGIFLNITQTPYIACVTSHEHFNIYAFMSIFDVVGKLLILYLLVVVPGDKLIIYAALLCLVNFLSITIYRIYCKRLFEECSFSLSYDKPLLAEMLKFSGWDSLGNITTVLNAQGITLLLNMFLTVAVNAARGIATTVSTTILSFVSGFITAAEPQLAKFYAQNDMQSFVRLIFNISKLTLFLLAIFAVPVFFEVDYVLSIWLTEVPEYTASFIKITIIAALIQYSNQMLVKGIVAIGRVKQITTMMVPMHLVHLPLVWLVLKLDFHPTAVYWVGIIPSYLALMMDLYILKRYVNFPSYLFLIQVLLRNLGLVAVSCIIPYFVQQSLPIGLFRFLIVCSVSVLSTLAVMWFLALNKEVRQMVLSKVFTKKSCS